MQLGRRLLSGVLVAFYSSLLGGLVGAALTFWMWGFGGLVTAPTAFVAGAMLGWKISLRDSVILFAGCFGSLVALCWLYMAQVLAYPVAAVSAVILVPIWALLTWMAYRWLMPTVRLWLAIGLTVAFVVHIALVPFVAG